MEKCFSLTIILRKKVYRFIAFRNCSSFNPNDLSRISAAKQSDGVLVHGGLCPTQLPGQQDRILKHVRATYSERPVYRLHAQRWGNLSTLLYKKPFFIFFWVALASCCGIVSVGLNFLFVVMANDVHIVVAVSAIAGSCFNVLETFRLFLAAFLIRIPLGQWFRIRLGFQIRIQAGQNGPQKKGKLKKFNLLKALWSVEGFS